MTVASREAVILLTTLSDSYYKYSYSESPELARQMEGKAYFIHNVLLEQKATRPRNHVGPGDHDVDSVDIYVCSEIKRISMHWF